MNKVVRILGLAFVLALVATPAMAAGTGDTINSGAIGAGLVCIGSAFGIGKLAAAAVESMARQPEAAGGIQTAMIIAAALIEGFTFYAIYVCSTQNPFTAAAAAASGAGH